MKYVKIIETTTKFVMIDDSFSGHDLMDFLGNKLPVTQLVKNIQSRIGETKNEKYEIVW